MKAIVTVLYCTLPGERMIILFDYINRIFFKILLRSSYLGVLSLFIFTLNLISQNAFAACGGTVRTWDGSSTGNWTKAASWTPANFPNATTEDAVIASGKNQPNFNGSYSIGCVTINSGNLTMNSGNTLTINGDYFRNNVNGGLIMGAGSGSTITMAGTGAQTFENIDLVENLTITNNTTVTLTEPFGIGGALTLSGSTTLLKVNASLTLSTGAGYTIPSGVTVEVGDGAILSFDDNVTVNGTLKIKGGGKVTLDDGKSVTVNSGGTLNLAGASGNIAILESQGIGKSFGTVINSGGTFTANYFKVNRQKAEGIQVYGTISAMDNGEFHYIKEDAIRLESGATIPPDMDSIGFYDEDGNSATNIDAVNYTGSDTNLDQWSGDVGGEGSDNEGASTRIDWGTQAATSLTLSDNTGAGNPPATIGQSIGPTFFGTFSFALSDSDTSTDITQVVLTIAGTATSSDVDYIQVYKDGGGGTSCVWDGTSTDTKIGSDLTVSGSPAKATVNLTGEGISTSSPTPVCLHVLIRTTGTASDGKTLAFKIASASDVTNSQSYSFSPASAPPVTLPSSTIVGSSISTWDGHPNSTWTNTSNWIEGAAPSSTRDCQVGVGTNNATLGGNRACQNATLLSSGALVFGGATAYTLSVYGSLDGRTGYTFTNAANGVISMIGANNQSMKIETSFPGDLSIDNTGTSPSDVVNVDANSLVAGDLLVNNGTLRINTGFSLTIGGNVTVASGAVLDIEPGASLIFSTDESVFTVNAGGTLELLGTSGNVAKITSSSNTIDYWIDVNGTIKAQYYQIENLGVVGADTGLDIGTGATIDSTNHLQNGAFSYPVDNNTKFLKLGKAIPPGDNTETLANMSFNTGGSTATGVKNISTDASLSGDVELTDWSGDLGGATYEEENGTYDVQWSAQSNTIDVTSEANATATGDAGTAINMGRMGFQQTSAGTFNDADISTYKLKLTGTGSASNVDAVRLYYDSDCDSAGGTLIDTTTFTGVPAMATFTVTGGEATIQADTTTPPNRCLYVEFDVDLATADGTTLGVQLNAAGDFATDQGYGVASGTAPPISLGTTTVSGATVTTWNGITDTDWFTASNWSAGVPDATKHCSINTAPNNPNINGGSGTAICKNLTIGNGTLTLQNATSAVLQVWGSFDNTGTFTQNDGTLQFTDDGSTASNQTVKSSSTLTAITFDKTAGGDLAVSGTSLTIGTLTIPASSSFVFKVDNGKTLQLNSNVTNADITFQINGGGTVKMANATTFTVNSGGILKMVGSNSSTLASMQAVNSTSTFEVSINTGEIQAQYYEFKYLGTNGVSIESGATISNTYHLQDGNFLYPVNNNSTFIKLKKQVPTNSMNGSKFDLDGSSATGTTNVDTTGAAAGTLTIDNYLGDLSGPTFDTDPTYTISWTGAQNTIKITQEATSPGTVNAGTTYTMGRFGFQQEQAGAGFNDTDITTLKLTLDGTAAASDISDVKIYYDNDCDSAAGTLIGTGTMSGSPATVTFNLSPGDATVQKDAASPPKRCIYVTYAIANGAVDSKTAGVKLAADAHFSNDQAYAVAAGTPLPVTLGTASTIVGASITNWTGTTDTDWFTAGNWDSGVPDSTKQCVISNQANDPNINGGSGTATCKTLNITNGILTLQNATSAVLEVYGNYQNTGILNQNDATVTIRDNGSTVTNQTIQSSSTINALTFNKTAGGTGTVSVLSTNLTISTLTIPAGSNFEFQIPNGKTLTTANSITNADITFTIKDAGTLKMGNGTTFTVNSGGILKMVGNSTADAVMTSDGASSAFDVSINTGEIQARYYQFDHLNVNGVSIENGATINSTNQLQDGKFKYPVNNSTTLLQLKQQVPPSDTMDNMTFDLDGSSATGTTNINTTGASAGTLTINTYNGDLGGAAFDTDPTYTITWSGAQNTIDLTQEATGPTNVNAGDTGVNMGRFGFQQTLAGAGYSNADLTSLKLTLIGSAEAADIDAVRIYYDSDCDSASGTLIGSGTFSGSPETVTFSLSAGQATVEMHATTPPLRCIYVEYDFDNAAVDSRTAGVEINHTSHLANDQGYAINSATTPPKNLGTAATIAGATETTWAGTVSTDWFAAGNWDNGVPDNTKQCTINDQANDPNINGGSGTAVCKSLNIGTGIVTLQNGTGAILEIEGNYSNTGTITQNDGTIRLAGTANQTITSNTTINLNATKIQATYSSSRAF